MAQSRQTGSIMTLPDERYRAVLAAERLLRDLCDPSKTPRVPKTVRSRASGALRHYPSQWDLDRAATACPEVFETPTPVEPLYGMVRNYSEQQRGREFDPEVTEPQIEKD